jgi:hypothetical protein
MQCARLLARPSVCSSMYARRLLATGHASSGLLSWQILHLRCAVQYCTLRVHATRYATGRIAYSCSVRGTKRLRSRIITQFTVYSYMYSVGFLD